MRRQRHLGLFDPCAGKKILLCGNKFYSREKIIPAYSYSPLFYFTTGSACFKTMEGKNAEHPRPAGI